MTKTVKNVIGKLSEIHEKLYGNYNKINWTRVEADRNSRYLEEFKNNKKMEAKKNAKKSKLRVEMKKGKERR